MASLEQRDLVDYAMKKFEDVYQEIARDYMKQDLDKLFGRIRRLEDKVRKLNVRIINLENRLEDRTIFSTP